MPTKNSCLNLTSPNPNRSRFLSKAASRCRCGSSSRPASTPARSGRSSTSSTAGRRGRGRTAGAIAGTRSSGRRRGTSSSCPIRAARPASARSSSTKSPATGAASAIAISSPGLDYVEKLPYVDKDRIGAAGGSFGGYMMDWFAVNDIAKRFKCLITHCSVWNFESMWGTTDELWFDEWEHQGLPWEKPRQVRRVLARTRWPATSASTRRRCSSSTTISTSAARSARGTSSSPRCNGRACPAAVRQLPGRGALGLEAAEQPVLAQGGVRLARQVRPAGREVMLARSLPTRLRSSRGSLHPGAYCFGMSE